MDQYDQESSTDLDLICNRPCQKTPIQFVMLRKRHKSSSFILHHGKGNFLRFKTGSLAYLIPSNVGVESYAYVWEKCPRNLKRSKECSAIRPLKKWFDWR